MKPLKAHVVNGQIVLDEPAHLPEGAGVEVRLVAEDEPADDDRAEIERGIEDGAEDFARGDVVDARELAVRLASR